MYTRLYTFREVKFLGGFEVRDESVGNVIRCQIEGRVGKKYLLLLFLNVVFPPLAVESEIIDGS